MSMFPKYEGEEYRDDRVLVMNLSQGKSRNTLESNCKHHWILTTYRNTLNLPVVRVKNFELYDEAVPYIKNHEPLTPLISRAGDPLEIPLEIKNINDKYEYYLEWLKEKKLFSTLSGKQHCPYWQDERGYQYLDNYVTHEIIVDGIKEEFFPSGKLMCKKTFVDDFEEGPSIQYYETGEIHIKCVYGAGLLNGLYERFHKNGQLMSKGELRDHTQVGFWEWFDEKGNIIKKKNFKDEKK